MAIETHVGYGGSRQIYFGKVPSVAATGLIGTSTFSPFWADTVYADADVWTSPAGCHAFHVSAGTSLATDGHYLVIGWSTTEDDDLSSIMAALAAGVASVAKVAKETTLTKHSGVAALKSDHQVFSRYSETPIKTIKIIAVGVDKVALLSTVTVP